MLIRCSVLTTMKIEDLTRTLLKLDKQSDPIEELISSNEKTSRKIALEIRKMSLEENQSREKTVEGICKRKKRYSMGRIVFIMTPTKSNIKSR